MAFQQYEKPTSGFLESYVVTVATGAVPTDLAGSNIPTSWQAAGITEVYIQAPNDVWVGNAQTGAKRVSATAPFYGLKVEAGVDRKFEFNGNLAGLYCAHGELGNVVVEVIPTRSTPMYKKTEK